MTSRELREKFLDFFKQRNHTIVPSSSLTPTDQSVLFTTAGMQQFKPYYLGEKSLFGPNAASCQKCVRTSDIDEVGDERHLTFFEMLGNFSFGGYRKKEAIQLAFDFLVGDLGLKIDYVSVFAGEGEIPPDEESENIWKEIDSGLVVKKLGRNDNFWGPTGEGGPCGPTTEIYVNGIEVWNIVFNQFYCNPDKSLKKLDIFGVDTGMGLERLAMASQNASTVFETDLFLPIMNAIPGNNDRARRIIADHVKAATFLISEGILPSNVERGYVLRRILRRAIRYGKLLSLAEQFLIPLAKSVIEIYCDVYPELKSGEKKILTVIQGEAEKFEKTLEEGIRQLRKINNELLVPGELDLSKTALGFGKELFNLYQSHGFPLELSFEEIDWNVFNKEFFKEDVRKSFFEELKKHQELSRTASSGMFKGGLADTGEIAVRYHTATHLLLAALRQVLGPETYQKGSNITDERLRFDFNYTQKLTEVQIREVEDLVNQKIQESISVEMVEMSKTEAMRIAQISFDPAKYGETVKVYKIGDFSIELCGGPHVKSTAELGKFKIIKEESSSAGVRRIRAVLE